MGSRMDYRTSYASYGSLAYQAEPAREYPRHRDLEIERRGKGYSAPVSLPTNIVSIARLVAIALVAVAVVCCVRIALVSATVSVDMGTQELSSQVSAAKKTSSALIVTDTALSQPSVIKEKARALDMTERQAGETLELEPDVVVTDENGNLSLQGSLQVISQG